MPNKTNPTAFAIRFYQMCCSYPALTPIAKMLRQLQFCGTARDRVKFLVDKISQDPGLPCPNPTSSFWQQDPLHPDMTTKQSAGLPGQTDVLIIGSGITAASISHHLLTSDDQISVVVAEARTITSGATGRNGGHILEVPYEGYDLQVSLLGREATKAIVQFRLDHLAELVGMSKNQMTEKAAKESEIRVVEMADAVFDQAQWDKVKSQLASFLEDFPEQRAKWKVCEKEEARKKLAIPDVYGAVIGPSGAIWPYRFVTNVFHNLLTQYKDRMSIETRTPVLSIETNEGQSEFPYKVTTPRGTINARHVVHATNGHVAHLLPRMRGRIFPLRGQMTVQRMDSTVVPNLGNERSWVLRHGKGFDYMTQNGISGDFFLGGGVLQGGNGGLDDVGNPSDDEENFLSRCHLRGVLASLFDSDGVSGTKLSNTEGDLDYPKLLSSWTGVMGFSCDGLPWVGRLPVSISDRQPNSKDQMPDCAEWIAAGFCGGGMVYCWRSGKALASMILNRKTDWFPKELLPTAERYRRSSPEEMAINFITMSL